LANPLKSPFTESEFCPPAAQLVREVCDRFMLRTPPVFQPRRVSADCFRRVFSASVTCPDEVVIIKMNSIVIAEKRNIIFINICFNILNRIRY
jgi:hypothetical protein